MNLLIWTANAEKSSPPRRFETRLGARLSGNAALFPFQPLSPRTDLGASLSSLPPAAAPPASPARSLFPACCACLPVRLQGAPASLPRPPPAVLARRVVLPAAPAANYARPPYLLRAPPSSQEQAREPGAAARQEQAVPRSTGASRARPPFLLLDLLL